MTYMLAGSRGSWSGQLDEVLNLGKLVIGSKALLENILPAAKIVISCGQNYNAAGDDQSYQRDLLEIHVQFK